MSTALQDLLEKKGPIRKIGVVGMGYVGIPSAVLYAASPFTEHVWGFQRDSPSSGYKIAMLNRGESPLQGDEPGLPALLREVVNAGRFRCTPDFTHIRNVDAVTLAIQTPFRNPADLEPDLSALTEGIRLVGKNLSRGTLVVLESTITPGTTQGFARQILEEESGLVAGKDFALAHAPERVMVGRLLRNIREHDRIIGGIDAVSTRRAAELYSRVLTTGKVIPMSAMAAEITKTAENTFRDLQIAAINELALYCEAMGVNVYDVREGIASLKGEGITRAVLYPGAGVGGHCLTKDTYHLERGAHLARERLDFPVGIESLYVVARKLNDFMPHHMARLTIDALHRAGVTPNGAKVALLGWAFIRNSDDARNTPAAPYRDALRELGADVIVHDPYVSDFPGITIHRDLETVLTGSHAIVIFTGHDAYNALRAEDVKRLSGCVHPAIIDGRNLIDPTDFITHGFVYKGIGRGDKNNHPLV
ncbi:MAG: nucleotide sugar dehydrogenase [Methanomicrobiales archaeon]|nr:nucleotide sugar dehydrogenase [Methanomicrobiales archaeon]